MMSIVDVSGFSHSGKGVICDLFKEFEDFYVSDYNFEFNLLRTQDGLLDNWSLIRADVSIKRLKNLIRRIGPKASFTNFESLFYSNGMNYDYFFNNKFSQISEEYINSLIGYHYVGEWLYSSINLLLTNYKFDLPEEFKL